MSTELENAATLEGVNKNLTIVMDRIDEYGDKDEGARKAFDTAMTEYKGIQTDLLDKYEGLNTENEELKAWKGEAEERETALVGRMDGIEADATRLRGSSDGKEVHPDVIEYRKAWDAYMRNQVPTISAEVNNKGLEAYAIQTLPNADEKALELFRKDLLAGVGSQGGFYIIPERRDERIMRNFETSPMRTISMVMTISSNALETVVDDNDVTTGGWTGEASPRGDTGTPAIQKLTIPVHEQFAQPKATQTMLDDSIIDVEAWLSFKVEDRITRDENTAFVSGDGNDKPKGFLAMDDWAAGTPKPYTTNALERVSAGAAGNFDGDGILRLQNSLQEIYQSNAIFGLKRASFFNILSLKGTDGHFLYNRTLLADGSPMVLLGRPVVFMDDMPTVAADAEAIVYGDFRLGYTIVDRIGIRVLVDPLTDKPFIKFYTTKRVGGHVTNFESLKIGVTTA